MPPRHIQIIYASTLFHCQAGYSTMIQPLSGTIFFPLIGFGLYTVSWSLGILVFKWEFKKEPRRHWQFIVLASQLIYVIQLSLNSFYPYRLALTTGASQLSWAQFSLVTWLMIVAVCLVVEGCMFLSHYSFILENFFTIRESSQQPKTVNLVSTEEGKEILINSISNIIVERHFCSITVQEGGDWKTYGIYENLNYFESVKRITRLNDTVGHSIIIRVVISYIDCSNHILCYHLIYE